MNTINKARRIRSLVLVVDVLISVLALLLIAMMFSSIFNLRITLKLSATDGLSSILALTIGYVSVIRPWLTRPRLELVLETTAPYSPKEEEASGGSWYLRIFVINIGLSAAKNCVGRLLEVRDNNEVRLDKFDPVTLFWQRQDDTHVPFRPVDIAGHGDYWILDLAKIEKGDEVSLKLRVVLDMVMAKYPNDYPSPGREPHLKDGTYYVLIGAQADNAYIRPLRFRIKNEYVAIDNTDYGFKQAPCTIEGI